MGIPLSSTQRALPPTSWNGPPIRDYGLCYNAQRSSHPRGFLRTPSAWKLRLVRRSTARFLPQITTMPNSPSFAAMQKSWTWFPYQESMLDVIPSVAQSVRQRDQQRCFITGTTASTDLVWMFPPCFAHLVRSISVYNSCTHISSVDYLP
ncbi:hypothetical protein ARMGADRAFT_674128 [Armillaria gallica]|uniref:Uncharacterized protein n=1 Tax=Armillaria gallica TaxID=47427 RepID=A0A2H3CQ86_ARMGA|nr:hypothetical protein ARMGADRAFT_674128 [Armillaria gallica]